MYRFQKANYSEIGKKLNGTDWVKQFEGKEVGEIWNNFSGKLIEYRNNMVPLRKEYKRSYPKWMTNKVILNINKRNKAWTRYNKIPNNHHMI